MRYNKNQAFVVKIETIKIQKKVQKNPFFSNNSCLRTGVTILNGCKYKEMKIITIRCDQNFL
jgi:hypothetical protein